ncbi:TPA: ABC transporter permease [Neisseria meningitidis]
MGCKVGVGWASAHQLHQSHQPHQSANLTGTGKPMPSESGRIGGGGGLKPTLQPNGWFGLGGNGWIGGMVG